MDGRVLVGWMEEHWLLDSPTADYAEHDWTFDVSRYTVRSELDSVRAVT